MSELGEVIARYGRMKDEDKLLSAQIKKDNDEIKEYLKRVGKTSESAGGYTVNLSTSVSEDFDNEKLIDRLKSLKTKTKLIKNVPTVDMEALENAIYNGEIKAEDLADCKVSKTTYKLTYSKTKEGKSNE
jgi:hypothetical protein